MVHGNLCDITLHHPPLLRPEKLHSCHTKNRNCTPSKHHLMKSITHTTPFTKARTASHPIQHPLSHPTAPSPPTPPLILQRTLPLSQGTKHTNKNPRQPLLLQPHTSHVQPLKASLTLHHECIGIIHQPIANTSRAIITLATAFRRGCGCNRWRAVERIGVGIVSAVRLQLVKLVVRLRKMGCGHIGRGLRPALIMCEQSVLGCTF